MRRTPRLPVTLIVTAGLVAVGLFANPAAAATPLFSIETTIGGCFGIFGPPMNAFKVSWHSAGGQLKASFQGFSDASGRVDVGTACQTTVEVGDRMRVRMVTGSDASRTFTVPLLTVALDRVTDRVSGQAPAGSHLDFYVGHLQAASDQIASSCTTSTRSKANGSYSRRVQGHSDGPGCPLDFPLTGADRIQVHWADGLGDSVTRAARAQFVSVTLGGSKVSGAVAAGQKVTIELRNAQGALLATSHGNGDINGSLALRLRDGTGRLRGVEAGDHVSGNWAGNVDLAVPDMHFEVLEVYGWIYGWCMPGAPYLMSAEVFAFGDSLQGTTDMSGETQLLHSVSYVKSGADASLTCQYDGGDRVAFSQSLP